MRMLISREILPAQNIVCIILRLRGLTTVLMDYTAQPLTLLKNVPKCFFFLYLLFSEVFYHLNDLNINEWLKQMTEYLRRDWTLVG